MLKQKARPWSRFNLIGSWSRRRKRILMVDPSFLDPSFLDPSFWGLRTSDDHCRAPKLRASTEISDSRAAPHSDVSDGQSEARRL